MPRTLPFFWTKIRISHAAITLIFIGIGVGCFKPDEKHVGVDDFPNSIHAQVNGFLEESKKSGTINQSTPTLLNTLPNTGFNTPLQKVASERLNQTRKSMAGFELELIPDLHFKCAHYLTHITKNDSLGKQSFDSLILCSDSGNNNIMIVKAVNTTIFPNGSIDKTEISDADGDGILNPLANGKSKARMIFTKMENNTVEKSYVIVGPGPDFQFNTEPDNIIYEANWLKLKTLEKDTLAIAKYANADPHLDSSIIDNAKPSLVDLELYEKGPTKDHVDAIWSKAKIRFVALFKNEDKELRRVRFEYESSGGRYTTFELLNLEGGADIQKQEKVQAHFLITSKAPQDTVDTLKTVLLMKIGVDLENNKDDSLYSMDVYAIKKLGEEKRAQFSFTSDAPIPNGKEPENGSLAMNIEYTDLSKVIVEGKLNKKSLDVKVKTRDEKHLHVIWDAQGRGVLLESVH